MTNPTPLPDQASVEFLFDPDTGRSFTTDLASPDPDFVEKLVAEAQRMRKDLGEMHKALLERIFKVSQMWMAGAALFAASALTSHTLAGALTSPATQLSWLLAVFYGVGFCLSLYGQRARQSAPVGVSPEAFNDWRLLRRATPDNLEVLLSTWQVLLNQAHDDIAWRAKWLNINLTTLGVFTVAALTIRAFV